VGIESDAAAVANLLKELEGKDVAEVIAAGREKLASVPSGGAVASSGGGGGAAAAAAPAAAAPKEEEGEEDADMGFSLFD
jgi:large subunit ribosomal protein LP2